MKKKQVSYHPLRKTTFQDDISFIPRCWDMTLFPRKVQGKPGAPSISCSLITCDTWFFLEKSSCHWEARLAQMEIESLCRAVVEQLPNTGGNICILGGCAAWSRNAGEVFRSMKVIVSDGQMLLTFQNLQSNILFKTSPYPTDAREDSPNLLT